MAGIATNSKAMAYERPGFGKTQYEQEDYLSVADLIALLDAVRDGRPAILFGCSQGADCPGCSARASIADLQTTNDFRNLTDEVSERSGGMPIGFSLSANHIEDDIDLAQEPSADQNIIGGRGGGTGAAHRSAGINSQCP